MQFTLFDPTAGRMLRDLGLASVEFNNLSFVQAARTVLDKLIEINGKATMDDVREVLAVLNIEPKRAGAQKVWAFAVPKLEPPPSGKAEKEECYYPPRGLKKAGLAQISCLSGAVLNTGGGFRQKK